MQVMYMLTSSLGICQQQTDFRNLGGIVRVDTRIFAHFLVGSRNVGIRRFTYQIHELIQLTPILGCVALRRAKIVKRRRGVVCKHMMCS